jgi:hypothetical protein
MTPSAPAPAPAPAPAGPSAQENASKALTAETLAGQQALNAESLKLNLAMAWLQMAMALTGKLSGR